MFTSTPHVFDTPFNQALIGDIKTGLWIKTSYFKAFKGPIQNISKKSIINLHNCLDFWTNIDSQHHQNNKDALGIMYNVGR